MDSPLVRLHTLWTETGLLDGNPFRDVRIDHDHAENGRENGNSEKKGIHRATATAKNLAGNRMASLTDSSSSVDPENAIANPDNIVVMPDGRVIIGEDSGLHRPNMLWVYDPGRKRGRGN